MCVCVSVSTCDVCLIRFRHCSPTNQVCSATSSLAAPAGCVCPAGYGGADCLCKQSNWFLCVLSCRSPSHSHTLSLSSGPNGVCNPAGYGGACSCNAGWGGKNCLSRFIFVCTFSLLTFFLSFVTGSCQSSTWYCILSLCLFPSPCVCVCVCGCAPTFSCVSLVL